MEIQLRFHFTKKKHYVKPRLAKPNHEEVSNVLRSVKCIENFEDVEIEVCGICFSVNDRSLEKNFAWIQCCLDAV